jgi:hypothetical protein
MRTLVIVTCALSLVACATEPGTGPAPMPSAAADGPGPGAPTADAEQEAIYSAALGRTGLTARVNSNGCTKRADFRVQVLDGYPAPTVILHRTRQDMCRSFVAGGVDLLFSWVELKLPPSSPIVLANPLTADPTPGR